MDLERRAALLLQLQNFGFSAQHPQGRGQGVLVTLEAFFDGNHDANSTGPQLVNAHPGLEYLYSQLRTIRARDDVSQVLVEAADAEWAYDSDDAWVVARRVVLVTAADAETISGWRQALCCVGQVKDFPQPLPANLPPVPEGQAAWHLVWA
jgi:hypothetical protein